MLAALESLLAASPALSRALEAFALLLARLLPLVMLTPLLGLSAAPASLRMAAALALGVGVFPAASLAEGATLDGRSLALEALAGAYFGLIAALPLGALAMSGRLVSIARGVAHPGERDLVEGEPGSALGQLGAMAGLALFFTLGGHLLLVHAFALGLARVPLGAASLGAPLDFWGLAGEALAFGVALSIPAFTAVLAAELALGLVSRAAPELPAWSAGMPLRALAGLVGILLSSGLSLALTGDALEASIERAFDHLSLAP